jgi:hypothetical protein
MPANRITTRQNATVTERVKIAAGVNRLVALDGVPCDLLECIAAQWSENATQDELISMKGTLTILLSGVNRGITEKDKKSA